ncbi:hypothetical protein N7471_014029 [Penicillium samsonianum]|uniref:uncharacterized protein n=1 Tax=Penicillium samsonianum TaxID=1882272 RepID=UPI002547DA69|nr:uncharacterized protein N7471_014029 [Penicillium samsonianum]KAJ6118152.1 hypothetical protein N7471_014029 [Penicillium samsonianum]
MAKPTLEGLPTELLILILLEIPDLASLKSIVLSSPIFHQAYLTVRQEALCRIVKDQWGLLLGDAIAATRSRGLFFDHHKPEAIALLDTWRRREEISDLALGSSIPIDEPSNLEEIFNLFYLHKVSHFFLKEYETKVPRPPWISNDQWENSILPIELSHTEKHRFLRALCRLQIYTNIFGEYEQLINRRMKRNAWRDSPKGDFCNDELAYRVFFGTMPPWEFQEIGCVWAYFTTMFDHIYKEISAGLHELVEKHMNKDDWQYPYFEFLPQEVQPPWWGGLNHIENIENLWGFSNSLASMGPEFVYRLLHGTPLVQRDMVMLNGNDLLNSFPGMYVTEENEVPFLYPADRHAVQDYEQLWSTLPYIEQPNLGWKEVHVLPDASGQTFEEAIDLESAREFLWRWGYAIFDDERLMAWKAPLVEFRLRNEPEFAI